MRRFLLLIPVLALTACDDGLEAPGFYALHTWDGEALPKPAHWTDDAGVVWRQTLLSASVELMPTGTFEEVWTHELTYSGITDTTSVAHSGTWTAREQGGALVVDLELGYWGNPVYSGELTPAGLTFKRDSYWLRGTKGRMVYQRER